MTPMVTISPIVLRALAALSEPQRNNEDGDMNDRELLELAAQAAGLVVDGTFETDTGQAWLTHWAERHGQLQPLLWNPLANDGDAFRLMVVLNLDIEFDGSRGVCVNYVDANGMLCTAEQLVHDDPTAGARRAIVLAAAEIGKSC